MHVRTVTPHEHWSAVRGQVLPLYRRRRRRLAARAAAALRPLAMTPARRLLTTKPSGVCLVIGAGAGIGAHVARRFALSGLTAVLCRRSSQEGLDAAVRAIEDEGGHAKGYLLNAVTPGSIEAIVEEVEASLGAIEVCIYSPPSTRLHLLASFHLVTSPCAHLSPTTHVHLLTSLHPHTSMTV